MSETPDNHELNRKISVLEKLFEELRKMVSGILEWKDRLSGAISIMVWVVGTIQSVVLVCLGFAANSLNNTASTLGVHAVELATTRARMESFMATERFTAEMNAAADEKMRAFVREEINHKHPRP